jgi:hypothetical protein
MGPEMWVLETIETTHLDPSLLPTCELEVALSNPLRNTRPQSPALKLAQFPFPFLLGRTHHASTANDLDLGLGPSNVMERVAIGKLGSGVPRAFYGVGLVRCRERLGRREDGLETVRFSSEITFALIIDLL